MTSRRGSQCDARCSLTPTRVSTPPSPPVTSPRPRPRVVMAFPKKLSAYMAYSNANRERVKAELVSGGNEKPSIADIARAISASWNAMTDEERAVRRAIRSRMRDKRSDIDRWREDAMRGTRETDDFARARGVEI